MLAQPAIKTPVDDSIIALQSLRESYSGLPMSTVIDEMFSQLTRKSSPIDTTDEGIVIEVKLLQYANALRPIELTCEGITSDESFEQP